MGQLHIAIIIMSRAPVVLWVPPLERAGFALLRTARGGAPARSVGRATGKRVMSKRSLALTRQDSLTSDSSDGFSDSEEPVLRQACTEETCLTEDAVKAILSQKEETVMQMLEVKRNTARLLLSRTRPRKWDVEKVLDAWFDDGVCSQLLGNQLQVRDNAVSCLVCGDVENAVVFSLSCGHRICTECLEGFLRSKLLPSDGDPPLQPPYTCRQMGRECEGVLDVASADLPLDEACQAVIASGENALESEATPFRVCVCGKFNRPAVGMVNCRCECGAHCCFACGQEACDRAASNPCHPLRAFSKVASRVLTGTFRCRANLPFCGFRTSSDRR